LAFLALAGPSWERAPEPLHRARAARIVALDLSRSMDVADVRPSRLAAARFKVVDLLRASAGRQLGLVIYARDAFVAAPLTEDAETLTRLAAGLSTGLMPSQGSNAAAALAAARDLLVRTAAKEGEVVLVTDAADLAPPDFDAARSVAEHGFSVSVLVAGTAEGGPIPVVGPKRFGGRTEGRFPDATAYVRGPAGEPVRSRADPEAARRLAGVGGGRSATLTPDGRDLEILLGHGWDWQRGSRAVRGGAGLDRPAGDTGRSDDDESGTVPADGGPWLALLLLPLAALGLRRGWLGAVLLGGVTTFGAIPSNAEADSGVAPGLVDRAFSLVLSRNGQAWRLLRSGRAREAARRFEDAAWKGIALARAGDFEKALAVFASQEDPVSLYNLGTVLARLGRLDEALHAFERALRIDPVNVDAAYNYTYVAQALARARAGAEAEERLESEEGVESRAGRGSQPDGASSPTSGRSGRSSAPAPEARPGSGRRGDPARNAERYAGGKAAQDDRSEAAGSAALAGERSEPDVAPPPGGQTPGQTPPDWSRAEQEQALEVWLRRLSDDPVELLRNKLALRYQHLAGEGEPGAQAARIEGQAPW